jgi:MHS family shikimate/dehydroshikimate transporter-like MFS transporter
VTPVKPDGASDGAGVHLRWGRHAELPANAGSRYLQMQLVPDSSASYRLNHGAAHHEEMEEGIMRDTVGDEHEGQRTSILQVAIASFIGTSIEWYDFFLYGTAAALVFGALFFPQADPLTGTLLAFATFSVGFVARPLGGIVFGHYGDRVGRKAMLVLSLLIMGVATFLIGALPTYATIGVLAPILLVVLRFLQGFAVGGEWGGAVLMAVEHAPEGKRGFYGSFPQMGVPAGLLLSTGLMLVLAQTLSEAAFQAWGWRIPFLLSAVLVLVGLFIRLKVLETPAFSKVKATQSEARLPILEVLREHPKPLVLAIGAFVVVNGIFYLLVTFILSYGTTQLGLPRSVLLNGVMIATVFLFVGLPAFASLSDRVGRRPVYIAGAAFMGAFAFPFWWMVDSKQPALIALALSLGLLALAAMYGPQAAFFSELFSTRVRYSGASLGYQLAAVLGGGLSPFIATALLLEFNGASWPIAAYMLVLSLISVLSVYLATETHQSEIAEEQPLADRIVAEVAGPDLEPEHASPAAVKSYG